MRSIHFIAIYGGAIFSALAIWGCGPIVPGTDSGSTPPQDAQTTETTSCITTGAACTPTDTVCCVMGYVCGASSGICGPQCLPDGELCNDASQCCSGLCDGTCD